MPTLLVVDDAQLDRAMVSGLLRKQSEWRVETACDGGEALSRVESESPPIDLVVTDLHMPGINGLELITGLRLRRPALPVVLITAKGSEMLALRALEQGAASYVPKSQLAERLVDTVREVWSVVLSQSALSRAISSLRLAHLQFEIEGDESLFPPIVETAQQHAAHVGLCDAGDQIRLGMALTEALRAALYHGNLELTAAQLHEARRQGGGSLAAERASTSPYRERRLSIDMKLTPAMGEFEIAHQGPPWGKAFAESEGPLLLEQAATRMLVLMRSLMDEARFSDDGRRITLVKRSEQRGEEGRENPTAQDVSKGAEQ
jgi:CheY-like chemotaxis protein